MTERTNDLCAQQRLRSTMASAQFDQSSLCAQWVAKDPWFFHVDSEDCSDWADAQADLESSMDTGHFVGFVMLWLICLFHSKAGRNRMQCVGYVI